MSIKKAVIAGSLVLALAACSAKQAMTYTATIDEGGSARVMELIQASERVLKRRFAGAQVQGVIVSVVPTGGKNAIVNLKLPDSAAGEVATRILADPFTFEIRVDGGVRADTGETDWKPTGIDGTMLNWIQPVHLTDTGELGVELQFTPAGRKAVEATFRSNKGKDIGIFVRDLMVSKLRINADKPGESIIISGIPSAKVAEIFADDVNVGLHVAFSPSK